MRAASVTRTPLALRRMRRAEVRELVESVGMRFEAVRRNLSLGEEGETVIDDIVGKDAAVGVLGRFRGVIAQHVRQKPVGIDRGDRFFPGVMTGMPHQVNKLIAPAITVVDRLAGVVLLFGLVGVEEAADRVCLLRDWQSLAAVRPDSSRSENLIRPPRAAAAVPLTWPTSRPTPGTGQSEA